MMILKLSDDLINILTSLGDISQKQLLIAFYKQETSTHLTHSCHLCPARSLLENIEGETERKEASELKGRDKITIKITSKTENNNNNNDK